MNDITPAPQQQTQQPPEASPKQGVQEMSQKQDESSAEYLRECTLVRQWTEKIKGARKKVEGDFDRMKENMRFARGLQWKGQKKLDDRRYVCNVVLRALNQGTALLYARNPECDAIRRDRMDFEIWDENPQSLMQAGMEMQQAAQMGMPPSPQVMALMMDVQIGQQQREMVKKIGETLRYTFQYMMDSLQPRFKTQMKHLVRRVKTCGVGYVKVNYEREFEQSISATETESTIVHRAKQIKQIAERLEKGELTEESPEVMTMQTLVSTVQASMQSGDTQNLNERITFDFPSAMSVIVDSDCKNLKGFVGAKWIAQEFILDVNYINSFFEVKIDSDKCGKYGQGDKEADPAMGSGQPPSTAKKKKACLWQVWDLESKSTFFLVDGHKMFVVKPEAVSPELNHFWPLVAITFNDCEHDPSVEDSSVYPPSDVDLMRAPQKERNRSREALRSHRIANTPCYMTGKGWLTPEDKEKINDHEDSAVIELEGAQIGTEISKLLSPFNHAPLQPALYDVNPVNEDFLYTSGIQEANLARPTPRVSATGESIAEQAKNTVAASNVDDLDDLLSTLAEMGGEIILRYFDITTVKRIAGRGAVLPQQNREDFLNEIMLTVKAASSGRPNKAMEIQNFTQIAPLLQAAGANPIGIVEEGVRRLGDQLDLTKFFPLLPTMPMQSGQSANAASEPSPKNGKASRQDLPMNGSEPQQQLNNAPIATL